LRRIGCSGNDIRTLREILNLLRDKEMAVAELIDRTKSSQSNISQHLSIMKSKGIVTSSRKGKNIYYKLINPNISKAFDIIREVLAEKLRKMGALSRDSDAQR